MPLKTKVKGTTVIKDITQLPTSISKQIISQILSQITESLTLTVDEQFGYRDAVLQATSLMHTLKPTTYLVLYSTRLRDRWNRIEFNGVYYHCLIWDEKSHCRLGASNQEATLFGIFQDGKRQIKLEKSIRGE